MGACTLQIRKVEVLPVPSMTMCIIIYLLIIFFKIFVCLLVSEQIGGWWVVGGGWWVDDGDSEVRGDLGLRKIAIGKQISRFGYGCRGMGLCHGG